MTTSICRHVSGVLVAAASVAAGCTSRELSADARGPKAVHLVAVESSPVAESTTYSAVISPNAQVDLAFRVPGYVVEIRRSKGADGRIREIEPGAAISKGVALARIRPSDYQAVVDKAHSSRNEATAGIDAAQATLVEARAGLTQAEFDYGRISTLWQQESITKPAYDAAKARLDAARAKVDAATAGVSAAKQRAGAAGAQAREAEIALGDTELRAPFDGVLLERRVDMGTLVSPALPAFTIADLREIKARFSAPDTALRLFHVGQVLPLTVDAFPSEGFNGQVLSVAPAADPKSRSFEITVTIGNPTLKLRSGMIASIQVGDGRSARRQLRIPIDALVHDPEREQYLVYGLAQKDGRTIATAIYVRPGPLVGNQVSILDGLSDGQRIVASGANLLRPGDAVKEIQ
jgi:membrane fusion protein, multidrug efflux system